MPRWWSGKGVGMRQIALKVATGACVAASLAGWTTVDAAVAAANEQDFFGQVYLYAHPSVTGARLLELGYQACSIRRSGQSTDAAKVAVWNSLQAQGVLPSMAEVGSLVHVAVDTLCPEVGYP
jgi:hypothetical protein